jgi:predicted RNA-binding protein YlxR (DUF448 family)
MQALNDRALVNRASDERDETDDRSARSTRTCAGCQKRVAVSEELVRVVLGAKEVGGKRPVVVDIAQSAFGRGAHVHPSPQCLKKACASGFARAFRCPIAADMADIATQIVSGCDRRLEGLLIGARRARLLAVGDEGQAAMAQGAPLAVVACDAGASATRHYAPAVKEGRATAWKGKAALGTLLGRDEVAAVVVRDEGIAREFLKVRAIASAAVGK